MAATASTLLTFLMLILGLLNAPGGTVAIGSFNGGSGNYLTSDGTDGLRKVNGGVAFSQPADNGAITVRGYLTGLAPRTSYVAVPYKDGACLPTPGVTAFPSGSFTTDRRGRAFIRTTVNPAAFNPAGAFDVADTRSVSIRQVVLQAVTVPGIPVGTPTVPNGAAVEACDRSPFRN